MIKFSLSDFKGENKDFFKFIIFGIFGILFYFYYKIAYNLQIKFIKSEAFKNYFNLLHEKFKKESLSQKNIENLTFEKFISGMIFVELIIIVVLLIFNKELFLDSYFGYRGNYLFGLFIVLFDFLIKRRLKISVGNFKKSL